MSKLKDRGAHEAARFNLERSPEWPRVEREHLATEPYCVCCGPQARPSAGLQVHHVIPFHYCIALGRPDLELDQRNLITLCENEPGKPGQDHHLLVGHLGDFKSSNLNVEKDARTTFFGMVASAIRASRAWALAVAQRLKPLDEMSEAEKGALRTLMDQSMPAETVAPKGLQRAKR